MTISRQVPTTETERGASMHLQGKELMAVLNEWRETGLRQQRLSRDRMEADWWDKMGKWQ